MLRSNIDGEVLTISVLNQGEPIPPTTMERLFQSFFRGGDATGRQQGLGLRLHIASEIAKAHGGEIVVTSNDSETTFSFRMALGFSQKTPGWNQRSPKAFLSVAGGRSEQKCTAPVGKLARGLSRWKSSFSHIHQQNFLK
ncbi:sensor histidine kinase [Sinorhizobium prairiense]|uniref:sensor histidine kinase n=1 Tax=unclassified Sinorhizobium TaxID=2613772 RepID=UPI0023D80D49|nr:MULTISPECIES: ATP-binding protein [unclassified Sinorhizobium]WEJ12299.1 ATP-binding protein [Sinorhizobium sp. M103]WEJ17557.1 ATP-binding protein [Sinorhizobium sp. K101]WEJ40490.1 ATP-binding protein [Sinorhizobium sp. C101]